MDSINDFEFVLMYSQSSLFVDFVCPLIKFCDTPKQYP